MENSWKPIAKVDFNDKTIMQYHIDTRDFSCLCNERASDDTITILGNIDNFSHTGQEVKETIERLYTDAGGAAEWRMLSLEGDGRKVSDGWRMKYIRIYRTDEGLLVCNEENTAISKDLLKSKVNQKYLMAH